jgi:hypothetical protein
VVFFALKGTCPHTVDNKMRILWSTMWEHVSLGVKFTLPRAWALLPFAVWSKKSELLRVVKAIQRKELWTMRHYLEHWGNAWSSSYHSNGSHFSRLVLKWSITSILKGHNAYHEYMYIFISKILPQIENRYYIIVLNFFQIHVILELLGFFLLFYPFLAFAKIMLSLPQTQTNISHPVRLCWNLAHAKMLW